MQTTPKRTAGWVVLQTLRNYGVDTVFGIPGTHNLELYRPLTPLGFRAVTTRHEQGAGYAADGWSLQTGLPGVVITTSGPGLLNALSAAGTAYCESRPMLILSPGPARGAEFADIGTLHETKDQLSAASAIVEWGRRVVSAVEAVQAVHDAFELFASSRPRPVYIEIPLDVLEAETDLAEDALTPRKFAVPHAPSDEEIAAAARMLAAARQPCILAGGGSRGATTQVRELAERLAAPVVTSLNAKGVLDEYHPLALGANLRLAAAREVARQADVLLVVGAKLGDAELWVDRLDARGQVVRIDRLASQLNKNQQAAIGLVGDAPAVLDRLLAALPVDPKDAATRQDAEARVAAALATVREQSLAANPDNARLGEAIAAALPEDAIIATDSSQIAYMGLLNALRVRTPNSTPYMATFATLGYGLPAALGAHLATPSRPTFVVTGDGALMFSLQEFITVVEQRASVTVIIVDNGGYAEIQQNEADLGIAPIGVQLQQPDWVALAAAFGGQGRHVTTPAELQDAVTTAVQGGGLQVIHLHQPEFLEHVK